MAKIDDYIEILNLGENFRNLSQEEQMKALAKAWRKFSLKWHPDRNKSPKAEEMFKKGNNANDELKEYIKSGYFSSEESDDDTVDYSTDDAYTDTDYNNKNYYRTESRYTSDINSKFWEKYNNKQEKRLFSESLTPVKIIITAFIISLALFVVSEFKPAENTNSKMQEVNTNNASGTNTDTLNDKSTSKQNISSGADSRIKENDTDSGLKSDSNSNNITSEKINFRPYINELQTRIKNNWNPPKGNESRSVEVLFTISKTGQLLKCKIHKSSGIPSVDQAALDAIKLTAPFKPLPVGYERNSIDIMFNFNYNVFKNIPALKY